MKPETVKAIGDMASLAELVAEARAAAKSGVNVGRPEGAITAREYALGGESGPVSYSTAQRDLDILVASGSWEVISAIAPTTYGSRKICQQKFYRKVTAPKKKQAPNAMDRIR